MFAEWQGDVSLQEYVWGGDARLQVGTKFTETPRWKSTHFYLIIVVAFEKIFLVLLWTENSDWIVAACTNEQILVVSFPQW